MPKKKKEKKPGKYHKFEQGKDKRVEERNKVRDAFVYKEFQAEDQEKIDVFFKNAKRKTRR